VRILERGKEPSREDFVAALGADGPHPKALTDYALAIQSQPRRRGPKHPRRRTWEDLAVKAFYQYELDKARHALARDSRRSRAVATVAKQFTAQAFGISKRTVERILAERP
jgi:hypothetical protein